MKVIMGRDLTSDLTKQYSTLFEKKGIKRIFSFAQDVYKSGKSREIVSFAVWEILHKLGLFPKKDYLVFDKHEAIKLNSKIPLNLEFDARTSQFFASNGLQAEKSELNWKLLYFHQGEILGSLYPDDCDLHFAGHATAEEFVSLYSRCLRRRVCCRGRWCYA